MRLHGVESGDDLALLVRDGVAVGREDHDDRRLVRELQVELIQLSVDAGLEHVDDVVLQPRQDDLRLGIAEAGVIFQHLRAVLRQHQAEEDHALERTALGLHRRDGRPEDLLLAERVDLGRIERGRGEVPHAARVQALVPVLRALIVLRRTHGLDGLAVHERQHADLAAGHELLDDHLIPRRAERLIFHDLLHAGLRGLHVLADQHALPERQAVRLQDDREVHGLQVRERRRGIREVLVLRGRDSVLLHKILRECLRTLEDRRVLPRSERADARLLEAVDESAHQRIVHADDRQADLLLLRELHEPVELHRRDRDALRKLRDAGIARGAVKRVHLRALCDLPCQRVLSSAASYQ